MADFEVERVGGELKRFGVEGSEVPFEVVSPYEPAGSQPKAIESLVQGCEGRRSLSGFAGRNRLGQDLYHGQDHRSSR